MNFDAIYTAGPTAVLRRDDGVALALDRWFGPTSRVDETIAASARGPVLDIGCGPGRLLDAFAARGVHALGIDPSRVAVAIGRAQGRRILHRDVFGDIETGWGTALLLDGSVGIGGDLPALLARVRELADSAIVEVDPPGNGTGTRRLQLEVDGRPSRWFAWAHVDAAAIAGLAGDAGFTAERIEPIEGRWFAWLT